MSKTGETEWNAGAAYDLVMLHLYQIPMFPRKEEAVKGVTQTLFSMCDGREHCEDVCKAAGRWPDWKGVSGLRELAEGEGRALSLWTGFSEKPEEPKCADCDDWGIITKEGRSHWCDCASGEEVREKVPRLLQITNRSKRPAKERRSDLRRVADFLSAGFIGGEAA
jgi:hypothetical protein